MNIFLERIFRMKYISRWSLMRNSIPENVSEHSLEVAMIAHCLAIIGKYIYGKDINPDMIAVIAMYHDATEVITGDMPTPVKYYDADISKQYKKIEGMAVDTLLSFVPEQLKLVYKPILETENVYVKAADTLSAYIKCTLECRTGNIDFVDALKQTKEKLRCYEMIEIDYFMDKFMPAFC